VDTDQAAVWASGPEGVGPVGDILSKEKFAGCFLGVNVGPLVAAGVNEVQAVQGVNEVPPKRRATRGSGRCREHPSSAALIVRFPLPTPLPVPLSTFPYYLLVRTINIIASAASCDRRTSLRRGKMLRSERISSTASVEGSPKIYIVFEDAEQYILRAFPGSRAAVHATRVMLQIWVAVSSTSAICWQSRSHQAPSSFGP